MFITKEVEWDMGHRVPNHKSKCRNPHGHRYRMQVILSGQIIHEKGVSDEGMLIDFSDIKKIAKDFVDEELDHGFMYYKGDEIMEDFFQVHQYHASSVVDKEKSFKYIKVNFIPTAENMAKWIFEQLAPKFTDTYKTDLRLHAIKLWETPTSFVEYSDIVHTDTSQFRK